ncbi:hypothetical protein [Conexibacter sp. CPCC 206217]|uniref:hypothetical protein n=1 Tax=Conexibacter sp. CPCC 206217 TaxID=3064574 RepID=UPI002724C578|nr:hypothetical protein [Conexibacter sp. CPCC 206217]MDO8212171.1 hypothetical protein [Conexibacter sp. CPCC 206217]
MIRSVTRRIALLTGRLGAKRVGHDGEVAHERRARRVARVGAAVARDAHVAAERVVVPRVEGQPRS